jgi:hypothetical protein
LALIVSYVFWLDCLSQEHGADIRFSGCIGATVEIWRPSQLMISSEENTSVLLRKVNDDLNFFRAHKPAVDLVLREGL